ncbi:MAG: DNA primase [Verrucomicrobiota bacterium JB023]|nr:DNA primase [Verrucomicrobiota bacterium JB023]
MAIPDETVELILQQTDIVDLINSYFPLKRSGSLFKACCPFHNEKTPSFTVDPNRQFFKCYGCGEGGTAIGFVMKYENLPFPDAIRKLANRAGVPIIEDAYDPEAEKARKSKSRLLELHNKLARHLHELLLKDPKAKHARAYLRSRGYGSEMAARWLVGWVPDDQRRVFDWAKQNTFTARELCNAGIASQRDEHNPQRGIYLRFRDRLMFPIHNDYGDIIAFSARQLREDPNSGKYINSPETQLFKKARVFFGLDKARRPISKEKFALVCEGQIDVIACHEAGFENTVAALGTAFTEDHAKLLKRYGDKVVLCYDSDAAGHKAVGKAYEALAPTGIEIRVVSLPEKEDPDSLIKSQGPEAFRALIDKAANFFDYQIDFARLHSDLNQPLVRSRLANALATWLKKIADPATRDTLLAHCATRLDIGLPEFRQTVARVKEQNYRRMAEEEPEASKPARVFDPAILQLCQFALQSSEAQDWLCDQSEFLLDHAAKLAGHDILNRVLGQRPDPTKPASINAFISNLSPEDQGPLAECLQWPLPLDPVDYAAKVINKIARRDIQEQIDRIHSRIKTPGLSAEDIMHLLTEARDLGNLLHDTKSS